ncbi:MAG TPA: trypsin-like peptidase domain-containing protein [Acidimicrobiales bacterium]|nr:trypsin-like peptidase domain-containing protein [Acidimicrobiales bacterium]
MTRLRLVLVLAMIVATIGVAPPARAGLLDSLLGGSSGEPTRASSEGATAGACQPLTVPVIELGLGSCSGVFPGARVQSGTGSCTLNFLFKGSDGGRYMGTAGHCAFSSLPISQDIGERVFAAGEGPEALDADGNRIGTFAYAVQQQPKDFGLIRLDDDVDVSPVVAQFGGPTGVNDEISSDVTRLSLFGNPLGIGGPLAIGRPLLAVDGLRDPDTVAATGLALPGDSGGPVLDEQGRAVGVLSAIGLGAVETSGPGPLLITRLSPQLEQAERAMGIDLTLQTAPRL